MDSPKEIRPKLGSSSHKFGDFEEIFQAIHHPLVILDPQQKILAANQATLCLLGATEEELLGRSCCEIFHQSDISPEGCPFQKLATSGHLETSEMEMTALGRVFQVSCAPVVNAHGKLERVIHLAIDISERKRMEESLTEREARLSSILRAAPVGIGIAVNRMIQEVNEQICRVTGYDPEELLGQSARILYPSEEEFHRVGREKYRQIQETGIGSVETQWRKKDGTIIEVLLSSAPLVPRDLTQGVIFTVLDLTSKKQTERDLRQRERFLDSIFTSIQDGLCIFDLDMRIIRVNPTMEKWLAHFMPLVGRKCYETLHDLREPCPECPVYYTLKTGKQGHAVVAMTNAQGEISAWVEHFTFPWVDSHTGKTMGIIDYLRDITSRRQAEEAFRLLVNQAPFGIFIVQKDKFRMVNPSFMQITGYDEEELLVRDPLSLVAPEFRSLVQKSTTQILEGEISDPYEYQLIAKNGECRWVREFVVSSFYDGKKALLGYCQDITEAKQLEAQLFQSQKLEAVGLLAGGLAHDFNNLLTASIGYCDLLLAQLPSENPLRFYVKEILKAIQRGESITKQLLAFSRRQILKPQVVNLNQVVSQMKDMLQRLLGEDIRLLTVLTPNLGAVKVDPGQVEQIIMNLAVNARDAMPKGGCLTIETDNFEANEEYVRTHQEVKPGRYVMLSVSDNGQGMDRQTLERIFEPFFTTKERGRGTGLGLAMVYGIVKQSGGHIWVYSEPGKGTTFKIYLPLVDEPVATVLEKKTVTRDFSGNETILLVEDDESLRNLFTETLRKYGYQVLTASHGKEALEICEKHSGSIDLLVTDVVLPQMSGASLASSLESRYPALKVLYMSGYTENAIVHNGILKGNVNFLQKPFRVMVLVEKIRKILNA